MSERPTGIPGSTVAYLAAAPADRQALEILTKSLQMILAMPQPIIPEVFSSEAGCGRVKGRYAAASPCQQLAGQVFPWRLRHQ